ncbi:MAG: hypothetical protein N4R32_03125 [Lactobacillus crispatus]|nr:hypothetical protein [Lactobacillus crispatus]
MSNDKYVTHEELNHAVDKLDAKIDLSSEIKEVPQATISVLQSLGIIQLKEGQYINETSFNKKYALLKSFLISKSNDSETNKNLYLRIIPFEIVLTAFGASLFQCIF